MIYRLSCQNVMNSTWFRIIQVAVVELILQLGWSMAATTATTVFAVSKQPLKGGSGNTSSLVLGNSLSNTQLLSRSFNQFILIMFIACVLLAWIVWISGIWIFQCQWSLELGSEMVFCAIFREDWCWIRPYVFPPRVSDMEMYLSLQYICTFLDQGCSCNCMTVA